MALRVTGVHERVTGAGGGQWQRQSSRGKEAGAFSLRGKLLDIVDADVPAHPRREGWIPGRQVGGEAGAGGAGNRGMEAGAYRGGTTRQHRGQSHFTDSPTDLHVSATSGAQTPARTPSQWQPHLFASTSATSGAQRPASISVASRAKGSGGRVARAEAPRRPRECST